MKYKVWDAPDVVSGTAQQVLEHIIQKPTTLDSEISRMNAAEYAQAILENASHYLPQQVVTVLSERSYPSDYDKALTYLVSMPASGMAILAAEPESKSIKGN